MNPRVAIRIGGRTPNSPRSGSGRRGSRSWTIGATRRSRSRLRPRTDAPPGAPPRQAPGLVNPVTGRRAGCVRCSTWNVDSDAVHAARSRSTVRAPLFHVEPRARCERSSISCERPSQGTRGRSITDLEARWQPMTLSAAENGAGFAYWERRTPRAREGDDRPETEGRVDLMERDEASAPEARRCRAASTPAEEAQARWSPRFPRPSPPSPRHPTGIVVTMPSPRSPRPTWRPRPSEAEAPARREAESEPEPDPERPRTRRSCPRIRPTDAPEPDRPAPGPRHRQPEGRRREDDDRGEPGRGARRARLPRARDRPRSAGQRDDRPRDQPPQRRGLDLRRDHERHADRGLRRADRGQEPLRRPGDHRPRRRRDRARPRVLPGAQAARGRSRRPATTTTS